jgi:hypothetical protein
MVPVLLVAFPLLLLVVPRLAWIALAVAIVMLVNKRMSTARTVTRRRVDADYDASV